MNNNCVITKGIMDYQVIQRDKNNTGTIRLEGTWECDAACKVMVRIVREYTGAPVNKQFNWQPANTNPNHTWDITIKDIPVGGPYRLETSIQNIILCEFAHNIYVGDLWVIAGQSNAAGIGRGEIEDIPEPGIHIFKNEEKWALAMHPFNEATRTAHPVNREGGPAHSPFLTFGKRIKHESGIPVGFIQTALGGSALSSWNPGDPSGNEPVLFKNMIHCIGLAGNKIIGILWYQGESDSGSIETAQNYADRFINFVNKTRQQLHCPELPVITVQLNVVTTKEWLVNNTFWSMVKEYQRQIPNKLNNVFVVPGIGLPLSDGIHNSTAGNIILGNRLADCALTEIYKTKSSYKSPEPKSAVISQDKLVITLEFDYVESFLTPLLNDGTIDSDFVVEDSTGRIKINNAKLEVPNKVVITLENPAKNNVRIHGLYGTNPTVNLHDFDPVRPIMSFYNFEVQSS